jgi:hypothetical protein
MSAIKLNSSGGGSITISPASTASTLTLTAPAVTGTLGIQGPAFYAYQTADQNISNATITAIVFQAELFDTNNNYDTSNGRFTPNVAGYYQISGSVRIGFGTGDYVYGLLKNGAEYGRFVQNSTASTVGFLAFGGSNLVYMNGTTDYVQFMVYQGSGTTRATLGNLIHSWFSGCMVRGA